MNLFRLSKGTVLALSLAAAPAILSAHDAGAAGDAGAFITDLGNQTLALVRSKGNDAERERKFAQIADSGFDVPRIARFVLGRYWAGASDGERQQFTQEFEHYMVKVYWQRFSEYSGETFKVTGQRADGDGATIVTTEVQRPNGQAPAKVEWSVAKGAGGYKIRDVSIEGISQALTYRQEFASIIERNDGKVAGLISELHHKAPS